MEFLIFSCVLLVIFLFGNSQNKETPLLAQNYGFENKIRSPSKPGHTPTEIKDDRLPVDHSKARWHLPPVYFDEEFKRSWTSGNVVRIPHIIHQTWKGYRVPVQFHNFSKSWVELHPNWQYWFWTDEDAVKFIKKRFPKYYGLFKRYKRDILRADAIRYFILYEFGGVYSDLDFEVIKNIDIFTKDHFCFLALEPTVHAAFNFGHWDYLACNALMGSVPKHPFFKYVIEHLHGYNKGSYVLWMTGPAMLTDALNKYKKIKDTCQCEVPENETIYLPDWKLFMPILADDNAKHLRKKCLKPPDEKWVKICDELNENDFYNGSSIPAYSYTVHRWAHTHHPNFPEKNPKHIFELIKTTRNVSHLINTLQQL